MKVYEALKFTKQINRGDRKTISTGCCYIDTDPESLGKYDTLEKALDAIKGRKPDCHEYHTAVTFYEIEEYAVEIYEADEDGEFIQGSDYETLYEYEWNENTGSIDIIER